MPNWSVGKHELLLEQMLPIDEQLREKSITQKDYDKKYRLNMILLSLHDIDEKVSEKDLLELHPDDFIDLFMAVYTAGKRGIEIKLTPDFQQGENKAPQQ